MKSDLLVELVIRVLAKELSMLRVLRLVSETVFLETREPPDRPVEQLLVVEVDRLHLADLFVDRLREADIPDTNLTNHRDLVV